MLHDLPQSPRPRGGRQDHNHSGDGPPVLWETMVFPLDPRTGEHDWGELECRRYATAQAAREDHAEILKRYSEKSTQ